MSDRQKFLPIQFPRTQFRPGHALAVLGLFAAFWLPTIGAEAMARLSSNPLIRTCTVNLGTFEVYPLGTDDLAVCRWNSLVVDSMTLVSNLDGLDSEAASVILSNITGPTCASIGAVDETLTNGEVLCLFNDESRLSLAGVTAGLSDPDRLHLKEVLLAR